MNILVVSDSHGNVENMVRAAEQTAPEMIFHLGDCWPDGQALHRRFPDVPFYAVPGNCDFGSAEPPERLVTVGGVRIFFCHGHTLGVKQSLMAAGYTAEEQNANLLLFGHTHRPFLDRRGNCLFLNPGSIGSRLHPSFAVVQIEPNGPPHAKLLAL